MVLHERAVMVAGASLTYDVSGDAIRDVVLKVRVKSLMLAVFDFQVCKVPTTVLGRQGSLLHIDSISIFCFLFLVD